MLINGKALRDAEFDIEWVGALSMEEYEAGKEFISKGWTWWLRTPARDDGNDAVTYIPSWGEPHCYGCRVDISNAVRPALRIGNLAFLNLRPGDSVEIAGKTWTVISEDLVLSDELIGRTVFNKDREKGNEYHGSNLESYILTWWAGTALNFDEMTIFWKHYKEYKG